MTESDRTDRREFERAHELFAEVCDLEADERAARLAEVTDELRELVNELLAADDIATTPLDVSPLEQRAAAKAQAHLPESIAGFGIVELIGAGGAGVVYKARQEKPERFVALKLIRGAAVSSETLRRFEHEAQVLAWLDHPSIARIYEAGTTDTGRGPEPYFAMEYIDGRPINRFVREEGLDRDERLALVAKVCDAVQHAHQKGVIHRDLKPANILVDGRGEPKVLDFGVARLTTSDLELTSMQTRTGELLGTLPYMSPEQLAADPSALDTRCDVYALGVLAYELLGEVLPHDVRSMVIHEAARVISEEEPTSLGVLKRTLRGDIETIVGKAMAKEKERRYSSADELAADIRRFLADEPIIARKPTTLYQVGKFARRNKVFVGGVVGVILALTAGVVVSTKLYLDKEEQRLVAVESQREAEASSERESVARREAEDAAEREREAREQAEAAEESERVARRSAEAAQENERLAREAAEEAEQLEREARESAEYQNELRIALHTEVSNMLFAPSPWRSGTDVKMIDVLDDAVARSDDLFRDIPEMRAEFLHTFGNAYHGLGRYEDAAVLQKEALDLVIESGADPDDVANFMTSYGATLADMGDPRGLEILEESVALFEESGGDAKSWSYGLSQLGLFYSRAGNFEASEGMLRRALEVCAEAGDELAHRRGMTLKALGDLTYARGDYASALEMLEEGIEYIRIRGAGTLSELNTLNSIAGCHSRLGRNELAVETMEQVVAGMRAIGGEEHEHFATQLSNLGGYLTRIGEYERSITYLEESLERTRRKSGGAQSINEAFAVGNLGEAYRRSGDPAKGAEYQQQSVDQLGAIYGERDHRAAYAKINLGKAFSDLGRYDDAAEQLELGITIKLERLPANHPTLTSDQLWLGLALIGAERHADAILALRDVQRRVANANSFDGLLAAQLEAGCSGLLGDFESAVPLGARAKSGALDQFGEEHWLSAQATAIEGLIRAGAGELEAGWSAWGTARERLGSLLDEGDLRLERLDRLAAAFELRYGR